MASQAAASQGKGASSQIELGPEALKMKAMGESMKLEPFEIAQLIAQGHKMDRETMLKERELAQTQREREDSLRREEVKWKQLLDRDSQERETLRESMSQQRPPRNYLADSFRVKLEPFHDGDDIDEFLTHFETVARSNSWPKDIWATRVLPLLQGTAREAVRNMVGDQVEDYESIKKALLVHFRKTPEHFRRAFRKYRRKDSETFAQAGKRMDTLCRKWFTMLDKDPEDVDDVWDMFMTEASYQLLGGGELEVKVREREPTSFTSVLDIADVIDEAKRISLEDRPNRSEKRSQEQDQQHQPHHVGNKVRGCFTCGSPAHKQAQCPKERVVPR